MYGEVARVRHRGHVVVLEVDHPVGVFHDGAGVACEEVLGGVVLPQGSELCPGAVPPERELLRPAAPAPRLRPAVLDRHVVRRQLVPGLHQLTGNIC